METEGHRQVKTKDENNGRLTDINKRSLRTPTTGNYGNKQGNARHKSLENLEINNCRPET